MVNELHSFEFEGVMITNRLKSPCGRFDLSEEESSEFYGPIMPEGFTLNTQLGGNCSGWEKLLSDDCYLLITCEGGGNVPESFPVLLGVCSGESEVYFDPKTQEELQRIVDQYSANTTLRKE